MEMESPGLPAPLVLPPAPPAPPVPPPAPPAPPVPPPAAHSVGLELKKDYMYLLFGGIKGNS